MATKRTSKVLSVSLPPEAATDFDRIAREEGRNKSELFREMLRVYRLWQRDERFESLQRRSADRARAVGVFTEDDVDRLIQEFRQGR